MPDKIPTDRAEIQAEIEALLAETPLTTERGRLFHLVNALIGKGSDTGGGGGASGAAVYKLTTLKFDSSRVSPNGVVSNGSFAFDTVGTFGLTGGNYMTCSLLDAEGNANNDLAVFANLFSLYGAVFSVVVVEEGKTPANFGNIKQLADINGARPTTFALKFYDAPYTSGASLTDGANYDIYVVPVQPFNPAGSFGSPIDSSEYSLTLSESTPSRFNVYVNNSAPKSVTQIIVGSNNGLTRAKLGSLSGRSLILVTAGQESVYSVSAVDTSNSNQITLTVTNLEDGVSSFSDGDQVYLAAF
ncbi:VHS1032 protein [Vibrio phage 1]|nr:VHS1032 protein [Vibrio phage 1]